MSLTKINRAPVQASLYYLDACFFITFMNLTDSRHSIVKQCVDDWSQLEEKPKIGISNHVFSEVVNGIFNFVVKRALSTYKKYQSLIHNNPNNPITRIPQNEQDYLIDLSAIQFLNKKATQNKELFPEYLRNPKSIDVKELIKVAKEDERRRDFLNCFYQRTIQVWKGLLYIFQTKKNLQIMFLDSNKQDQDLAQLFMQGYQLDSTDAIHLAIAFSNGCGKFITLDGDFSHKDIPFNIFPLLIEKVA